MIANYVTGGGARVYHHTAPISMIYGLHAGLGVVLDEGLDNVQARHRACGERLQEGLVKLGFDLFAQEGHRLPELTSVVVPTDRLPDGMDEAAVRRLLLDGALELLVPLLLPAHCRAQLLLRRGQQPQGPHRPRGRWL